MKSYKEHIKSLSKEQLELLIMGTNETPPLLTKDEPLISRPQLIWAITRIENDFVEAETKVDAYMSIIQGHKWDKVYNYDYLRFDVKKPSFSIFIFGFILSAIGAAYLIYEIVLFIIEKIEWI